MRGSSFQDAADAFTERLTLRAFEPADANDVQSLAGDFAIAETTLHVPHPDEDGMAQAWISTHASKYDSGELAAFAIVRKSDLVLLEAIGISISPQNRQGDLGYWIGVPYWNQGYCTEAAACIVGFAFSTLSFTKLRLTTQREIPLQAASCRRLR